LHFQIWENCTKLENDQSLTGNPAMRISDDRYSRDLHRFELALRFIKLEARTHTIRLWTGLSDDRIRKLYHSYGSVHGEPVVRRHRGKSPQQAAWFTRSAQVAEEAAALAGICCMFDVISPWPARTGAGALHSAARGELLCYAYETYRAIVHPGCISFEHAVFLVTALSRGDELRLLPCPQCHALLLTDALTLRKPQCTQCLEAPITEPIHAPLRTAPHPAAAALSR
jgi:hypothetical protein